ncbi:Germ cell-less protein-like 1 [Chytriomyces hyalinus]|nr:Germ cell-less protein-like 1 [Chytriomyces hyalinus]
MEPYVGKLLASFKRLYLNQLYSDITLTAFGHSFKLHRIVLVSNAYFASLIDGPWAENGLDQLTLHFDDTNISLEALKTVIARMYGIDDDDMNLKQNVLSLLATGCFFDDEPLCIKCVQHIESDMSSTTVIPYLTFAERNYYGLHSESILHACLTTLCKNASNALYLPSIATLPRVHLASMLASDCLHVENEAMRFELVANVMQLRRTSYSFSSKSCSTTSLFMPAKDESNKWIEKEQGGHRRETSASSTDTLIEQYLCVKESFPLDTQESFIQHQDDEEQEDIQSLHQQIMSKSILYSNLPFTQLQKIRRDTSKPNISDTILQKALWQQIELRSMVLCADTDALDLGIQYDSQSDDDDDEEEAIETDNSEYEATSPVGSFNHHHQKRNMPMQDTETMEGGKGVFDLIRAGSLWNHVACPPFRFGCTFDGTQLEKMEVVGSGVGAKIYSGSNFYAGSMWQVYIQKLDGNEGPALGVYLQRTLPKETEKDASNVSHYIDKRIHARVWFQIICYFGNSQCCILESKPDLFKAEQSWGWRSTKMFKDVCAGVSGGDSMLKCAVVIGQT